MGLFLGGIPTRPDVKKIMEHFKNLSVGQEIEDAEIMAITDLVPKTSRYQAVTSAWRRQVLNEMNLFVAREHGKFKILTSPERITKETGRLTHGLRQVGRSARLTAMVPASELDDIGKARQEHNLRKAHFVLEAAKSAPAEIAAPNKTPVLHYIQGKSNG